MRVTGYQPTINHPRFIRGYLARDQGKVVGIVVCFPARGWCLTW